MPPDLSMNVPLPRPNPFESATFLRLSAAASKPGAECSKFQRHRRDMFIATAINKTKAP